MSAKSRPSAGGRRGSPRLGAFGERLRRSQSPSPRRATPAVVLGLLLAFAGAFAAVADAPAPVHAEADRPALERAFADHEVETSFPETSRLESMRRFLERLSELLESLVGGGALAAIRTAPLWIGALILLVLAALVLAAIRFTSWWRRRRRSEPAAASAIEHLAVGSPASAALWRERAESRLEAGDLTAALEAIWWWFASIVAAGAVDPSWTGRELLRQARRPDLLSEVRQLDAFRYGRVAPSALALRRYLERLRGELA